jgi:hypothetical protein
MGMIRFCSVPGCNTKTLGKICFEHERSFGLGPFRSRSDSRPTWLRQATASTSSATAGDS